MNKNNLLLSFLISLAGLALPVAAQTTTPANTSVSNIKVCQALIKACQSANYTPNGTAGKNLLQNCVVPIMSGQTVPNLTAKPEDIQTCKDDMSKQPCAKIQALCYTAGYKGGVNKLTMFDCIIPLTQGKPIDGVNPSPEDFKACKAVIDQQIQNQPCLRVMLACKAAGYSPDSINGPVFARNCFNPILAGQAVMGVNIDQATAQACKNQTKPTGSNSN